MLKVRVEKTLEGQRIDNAVPVRVRPAAGTKRAGVGARPEPLPVLAAPAAPSHRDAWATAVLPVGTYDLEAVLPSGEILTDQAEVTEQGKVEITLRGEHSANEWRSWAHFSGARDASPTALRRMRQSDPDEAIVMEPPPQYSINAGSAALSPDRLNPVSWDGWFDYLSERWRRIEVGSDFLPDLQFASDTSLRLIPYPAGRGEPTRITVFNTVINVACADVGKSRQFISITSAKGTRVVSVPWPWFPISGDFQSPFFELLISETSTELLCEAVVRDEHLGGLMAYLNAGRVGVAGELLSAAHGALFEKYNNPLGAAAGGYVLLSTDASESLEAWPHWLDNLARDFPDLPDAAILRAKWLLDQGSAKNLLEARMLLANAYRRGIPFFTAGVVWLIDGLRRIAKDTPEANEALAKVRTVARSLDLARGITSFHLPAPGTRGSRYPTHVVRSPTEQPDAIEVG